MNECNGFGEPSAFAILHNWLNGHRRKWPKNMGETIRKPK